MVDLTTSLNSITETLTQATGMSASGSPDPLDFLSTLAPVNQPKVYLERDLLPEYACTITCSDLGIVLTAPLPPDFEWSTEAVYETPFKEVVQEGIGNLGIAGAAVKAASSAAGISYVTQALTAKFWAGSSTGAITLPLIFQAERDEIKEVMKPLLELLSLSLPRLSTGQAGGLLQAPGPSFDFGKLYNSFKNQVTDNTETNTTSVAGQVSSGASSSVGSIFSSLAGRLTSAVGDVGKTAINQGIGAATDKVVQGYKDTLSAIDRITKEGVKNRISLQIGRYIFLESVVIRNVQHRHLIQPVGYNYGQSSGNIQRIEVQVTFEPFMDITQNDLPSVFMNPAVAQLARSMIDKTGIYDQSQGYL